MTERVVFRPLYQQIKVLLIQALKAGQWAPGSIIPSEFELAAQYGVSQGTVRKAIDELVADNVLMRRQGKGTFVSSHAEPRAEFRFLRLVSDAGEAMTPENHILGVQRILAPDLLAQQLSLKPNDSVVEIQRVQFFAGQPINFEHIWLRGDQFKKLTADLLQSYQGPMYALFERQFAIVMVRAEEEIRAVAASADEALQLKIAVGTPLLSVYRRSFSYGEHAVEVRHSRFITHHFHYQHELN